MESLIEGREITTKRGEPLLLVNADTIAGVPPVVTERFFGRLAGHITDTYRTDMLPKSASDLRERLQQRRLVAAMPMSTEQESVQAFCASCNIDPLFDQGLFQQEFSDVSLGNSVKIPTVIELGGVIVDPLWQGHGIGERMAYFMLHELGDQIRSGEVLVVLTTKHAAMMLTVLPKIGVSEDEFKSFLNGLGFRPYVHDDEKVRMIGALTCTCEEPLGLGYGYSRSLATRCSRRVSAVPDDIGKYRSSLYAILGNTENGHIPCTMAVSSGDHAERFSRDLEGALGRVADKPFDFFVNRLRERGYYGEQFSRGRDLNGSSCSC